MSDIVERAERRLSEPRLGRSIREQTDKDLIVISDLLAEVKRLTPRSIETAEELEALPNFSVVRSEQDNVLEKDPSGWYEPGVRHECIAADIALPATVLYIPEGGDL